MYLRLERPREKTSFVAFALVEIEPRRTTKEGRRGALNYFEVSGTRRGGLWLYWEPSATVPCEKNGLLGLLLPRHLDNVNAFFFCSLRSIFFFAGVFSVWPLRLLGQRSYRGVRSVPVNSEVDTLPAMPLERASPHFQYIQYVYKYCIPVYLISMALSPGGGVAHPLFLSWIEKKNSCKSCIRGIVFSSIICHCFSWLQNRT